MSGDVIFTGKGEALIVHVVEESEGFAVIARVGPREGVLSVETDKAEARALARGVVACEALPGFRDWLASGGAAPMGKAF